VVAAATVPGRATRGWGQHQDTAAGTDPLRRTGTPSSRAGARGPAMLCHLPAAPASPGPGHSSLSAGMAPSRNPGLDGEVPFLLPPVIWPHPVAGPLQRLLPPRPVPAPRIPGAASHGPAWLSRPVIHPEPVPVPAERDVLQWFPKRRSRSPDVGLGGSPVPVPPSPRGGSRAGWGCRKPIPPL